MSQSGYHNHLYGKKLGVYLIFKFDIYYPLSGQKNLNRLDTWILLARVWCSNLRMMHMQVKPRMICLLDCRHLWTSFPLLIWLNPHVLNILVNLQLIFLPMAQFRPEQGRPCLLLVGVYRNSRERPQSPTVYLRPKLCMVIRMWSHESLHRCLMSTINVAALFSLWGWVCRWRIAHIFNKEAQHYK